MKKVIGVLVIFLLVATLALVVTGVYRILNMPDVQHEKPDNTEDTDDGDIDDDKGDGKVNILFIVLAFIGGIACGFAACFFIIKRNK
jgi:hypothetical protein